MCVASESDLADLTEQAMDAAAKYAHGRPSQSVSKVADGTFRVTVPDAYTGRTTTPPLHQELSSEYGFAEGGATHDSAEGTVTYTFQHSAAE